MNNFLQRLSQNKHTSGAAIAYVGIVALTKIGGIWFPAHQHQFDATAEAVKGAAVAYGLLMAGDSNPQPPKQNP